MAKAFNFRPNGSGRALLTAVKHTPVELDIPEYDFSKTVGDVLDRDVIQRDKEAAEVGSYMKIFDRQQKALPFEQKEARNVITQARDKLTETLNHPEVGGSIHRALKKNPNILKDTIYTLSNNPYFTQMEQNFTAVENMAKDQKTPSSNLVLGDNGIPLFNPNTGSFLSKGHVETVVNDANTPSDYFGRGVVPTKYESETRDDVVKKINDWYKSAGSHRWSKESVPQVGNISGSDIQAIMSGTGKGETNEGNLKNVASYLIKNGFDDNTYRKYANSLHSSPDFFKRYKELLQEADNRINADIKSAPYKASDLRQLTPEQKNELAQRALLEVSQQKFKEDIESILPIHKKTETGVSYSVNKLSPDDLNGSGGTPSSKVSDLPLKGTYQNVQGIDPRGRIAIDSRQISGIEHLKAINPVFGEAKTVEGVADKMVTNPDYAKKVLNAVKDKTKFEEILNKDLSVVGLGRNITPVSKENQKVRRVEELTSALKDFLQSPEGYKHVVLDSKIGAFDKDEHQQYDYLIPLNKDLIFGNNDTKLTLFLKNGKQETLNVVDKQSLKNNVFVQSVNHKVVFPELDKDNQVELYEVDKDNKRISNIPKKYNIFDYNDKIKTNLNEDGYTVTLDGKRYAVKEEPGANLTVLVNTDKFDSYFSPDKDALRTRSGNSVPTLGSNLVDEVTINEHNDNGGKIPHGDYYQLDVDATGSVFEWLEKEVSREEGKKGEFITPTKAAQ